MLVINGYPLAVFLGLCALVKIRKYGTKKFM